MNAGKFEIKMRLIPESVTNTIAGYFVGLKIYSIVANVTFDKIIFSLTAVAGLGYLIMQGYFLYLKTKKFKKDNDIKKFL